MNHREQRERINVKRMREDLEDDDASHIEELLAAAQQEEKDSPVYREEEVNHEH